MSWKGWEDFVPPTREGTPPKVAKPSKYRAQKTVVEGIRFDSKREAERFLGLAALQQAGAITALELQPQYPLKVVTPNGLGIIVGRYIADFRYVKDGRTVVEDSKGYRGKELYVWKKKHVEAQYGIQIVEV